MASMAYGKKSHPAPSHLHSLVFGLVLLLGAETVGAQIRTVLVSPVPGDPVASGTALRNALAGIPSPSTTDRWLLKIEPGIYDIGATSLQMRSWVDIEGSGIGVTTIRGSVASSGFDGTIQGANDAELRLLTVEALGVAMSNYLASPRLYRVKLSATAGSGGLAWGAWGIRNVHSSPRIEECEITVTHASTAGTSAYGVVFRNDLCSLPAGRSSILRSKIVVSGAQTNHGVYLASAQFVSEIRDSRIDVTGGQTTYGIYAYADSCSWMGNETLQIRNTEIYSSRGSSASYGIDVLGSSPRLALDINGSRIWGWLSPTSYGIVQGGPSLVKLQWSYISGMTQTVYAGGSATIQSTALEGGPMTAVGWHGCMGVWDENAIFYTQGCP